jgi:hypothetical protein
MLKLKEDKPIDIICAKDMGDGQIGVIIKWSGDFYLGYIIQRYGNYLITLGAKKGQGFGQYFSGQTHHDENCQVRILKKGETLIVD